MICNLNMFYIYVCVWMKLKSMRSVFIMKVNVNFNLSTNYSDLFLHHPVGALQIHYCFNLVNLVISPVNSLYQHSSQFFFGFSDTKSPIPKFPAKKSCKEFNSPTRQGLIFGKIPQGGNSRNSRHGRARSRWGLRKVDQEGASLAMPFAFGSS